MGQPIHWDHLKDHLYPGSWESEDFTYRRIERLLHNLRGGAVSTFSGTEGIEQCFERIQPHSAPLSSASPAQSARYEAYAAAHLPRTREPQGPLLGWTPSTIPGPTQAP